MMAVDLAPRMLQAMPQAYSTPAATPCTSPWGTPEAMQLVRVTHASVHRQRPTMLTS